MKLKFANFELSKKLQDIGFNEEVKTYYDNNKELKCSYVYHKNELWIKASVPKIFFSAPTLELAKMWFREKHGINISITVNWNEGIYKDSSYRKYTCQTEHKSCDESIGSYIGMFETYEEALEQGLLDVCRIVNKKQNHNN